jgi:hypothetical protein
MKDGRAGEAQLNEPNGLALAGGKLYIADTNNHAIRIYDPGAKELGALKLTGVERLAPPAISTWTGEVIQAPAHTVAPGQGSIDINLALPKGYKLNAEAPTYVGVSSADPKVAAVAPEHAEQNLTKPTFPLKIPAKFNPGQSKISVDLVVYYCESQSEGVCLVKQVRIETPLTVIQNAKQASVTVSLDLTASR